MTERKDAAHRSGRKAADRKTLKRSPQLTLAEAARETMTYDASNRATSWSVTAGSESFTYRGAEWHRFSQTARGETTMFLYDGENVVADVAGGQLQSFYATPFLDENLSLTRTNASFYYSQDGLGSVRTLTNPAGSLVNRYDYLAFDRIHYAGSIACVQQRYGYTGREHHVAAPLVYYRYRHYQPLTARFSQRDPAQYAGSIDANMYSYVLGRPVSYVDAYGLLPVGCTGNCRTDSISFNLGKYLGSLGLVDLKLNIVVSGKATVCECACWTPRSGKACGEARGLISASLPTLDRGGTIWIGPVPVWVSVYGQVGGAISGELELPCDGTERRDAKGQVFGTIGLRSGIGITGFNAGAFGQVTLAMWAVEAKGTILHPGIRYQCSTTGAAGVYLQILWARWERILLEGTVRFQETLWLW